MNHLKALCQRYNRVAAHEQELCPRAALTSESQLLNKVLMQETLLSNCPGLLL